MCICGTMSSYHPCCCATVHLTADITNSLVSYIYRKAGTYYAYSPRTRTCDRLEYQGCGGNQNRFESQQDCADICGARLVSVQTNPDILTAQTSGAVVLRRGRRALDQDGQQVKFTHHDVTMKTNS